MPHFAQLNHFRLGVSHLKQLTCTSWRSVLKILLPFIVNLFDNKPDLQKKVEKVWLPTSVSMLHSQAPVRAVRPPVLGVPCLAAVGDPQ